MEGLPELPSSIVTQSKCKTCKPDLVVNPDRRLLTWERNQKESQRIRDHLSLMTQKPKDKLLMDKNTLEKHRRAQEERAVLTYANIRACRFDKYRGNPAFWKMAPKLYSKCEEDPDYFAHLSLIDRGIVPSLEYIRIPKLYRSPLTIPNKSFKPEALKRLDKLCLKKIQPHIPELEDIYLRGEEQKKPLSIVSSASSFCMNVERPVAVTYLDNHSTIAMSSMFTKSAKSVGPALLTLNDQGITAESRGVVKSSVIIDTACSAPDQTIFKGNLLIVNHSSWALRVSFNETQKKPTFQAAKPKSSNQHFFFDRNYKIIMPAEKVNIPFWFKASKSGFYDQLLVMSVMPDIWHGMLTIQISLNASLLDVDTFEKCYGYLKMIQDRVRNQFIRNYLDDIRKSIPTVESDIKMYTYDRGVIFEALNSRYDPIHDRPKYLYDKEVVDELEAFYDSVRLDSHPVFWSLVLNDLRTVTKDRELFEENNTLKQDYQRIFETIELNKQTRIETARKLDEMFLMKDKNKVIKGRKPSKPSSASKMDFQYKGRSQSKFIPEVKEPELEELPQTLSGVLEKIISKLQSPVMQTSKSCNRIKLAYNLLCSYIDKTTSEVRDMCQNYFSLERKDPLAVLRNTFSLSHIKCEKLLACEMDSNAFCDYPRTKSAPQPAWALQIPMDDYQARYDAMHPGVNNKKTKLNARKSKESLKKKESISVKSKDTKKTSKTSQQKFETLEALDDLHPEDIEEEEEEESKVHGVLSDENWFYLIPHNKVDHYRNNIYAIFYKNLCDFVDDLQLVFEMVNYEELTSAQLQGIKFTQQKDLMADQGLKVECVNLKQNISNILKLGDVEDVKLGYDDKSKVKLSQLCSKLVTTSSSVWDVLKAYVPQRLSRKPINEGDIYVKFPSRVGERVDDGTDVTPEEVITERNVQTSICSDVTVHLNDDVSLKPNTKVCICGKRVDRMDIEKRVLSFHNSECFQSVSTLDSLDISTTDT